MMPLTLMLLMTERSATHPAVSEAVARWGGGEQSVRHVRSSANHIFRFERGDSVHYLRLSPASEREPDQLRAELDFVAQLDAAGVGVARPVRSQEGTWIEKVADEGLAYYAVVFEGLTGEMWLEPDDLTPAMYRAWGQTLGQIHRASQGYVARGPQRRGWRERLAAERGWLDGEPVLQAELARSLAWLDGLPRPAGSYGLIHGDPELDNLVWDGGDFQVLDFDDAQHHLYAFDVALALADVWEEGEAVAERTGWFLEGYEGVPGTPPLVVEQIPRFLRLSRLLKAARLLRAYAGLAEEGVPEWVVRLRTRHRRWLAETRAAMAEPFAW